MDHHGEDQPAPRKRPLDQTPEERAEARRRLDKILEEKNRVALQTPMGRLEVGRGDEKGFEDEEVPEALSSMREIWAQAGQLGSKHDPSMRLPSIFKDEGSNEGGEVSWEELPSSGQSSYDSGEAVRRAREAFRATLRREGKLRE